MLRALGDLPIGEILDMSRDRPAVSEGIGELAVPIAPEDVRHGHGGLRPGGHGAPPSGDNRDSIGMGTGGGYKKSRGTGNAHDIVVDRCSFTWSVDETVSVWYRNKNITIQNCIIAEALHWSIHSKSQETPPKGQSHP